jgi:hypothetical protein
MFVDIETDEGGTRSAVTVPRAAVQVVGDRSVVYVANPAQPGQFTQRVVETGAAVGDMVELRSGVTSGEVIVTEGSFAVRAEAERLGIRATSRTTPTQSGSAPAPSGSSQIPSVRVTVSEKGFEPARVSVRAGVPARLTFVRTTDATCATEVAIPSLNITRELPLNEPVTIELKPAKSGEISFACGMNMFSGTLVVQ